ncbi:helix-turn-helix domain-containing protein [Natronoflexus pectinivorans]|uniref:AraC-like DNA-binding protein n=1 Tax=Natronoflexus pectinivorans TaxID=682526 RepID=A0A4R2GIB0_9BACT|nr:helix-turn-helix domain-containing protein [Natronoflexus pectinivorans]TCO08238.1 AraC-like DNA-binding protein [Natronoflexus pectinivorans]
MDVIFIAGIFMSFFIGLLLITKKGKALPDKILSIWVLVIGFHLLGYHLYYLGLWDTHPHLVGITAPFPLLHGPFLYLYSRFSLRNDLSLRKADYIHFVPFVFSYLYMSRFFFFYSADEKVMVDKGLVDDFSIFSSVLLISFILSGLLYPIFAYRLLSRHRQIVDANFSYDEKLTLDWVKYGIYGIGGVFITVALVVILREGFGITFPFNADLIFYSMIVFLILMMGFFGIRQKNIFSHDTSDLVVITQEDDIARKYYKTGLNSETGMQIHKNLGELMQEQKPYLNPRLTLSELAVLLNISPNQLSQVINQYERVNFHDFVNRYRVDEFISISAINNHLNILGLALDSGFNSKSSFNAVFKKHKGITPSQFLRQRLET